MIEQNPHSNQQKRTALILPQIMTLIRGYKSAIQRRVELEHLKQMDSSLI